MTKAEDRKLERRRGAGQRALEAALAPGLYAATIELASKGSYRLRVMTGERTRAQLGPGVDPALVEECLRERRTVLVMAHPTGAVIVGALQVTASRRPEKVRLAADEIEIDAARNLVLRVGKSLIVVDEHGGVQIVGEKMTMRMAKALRVLSANVELP